MSLALPLLAAALRQAHAVPEVADPVAMRVLLLDLAVQVVHALHGAADA